MVEVSRGVARVEASGHAMQGDAVDISAHGVCLTLPRPLEVGSSCRLDLELPRAQKRTTSVVACVCFCLQTKSGYRVGLNYPLTAFVD